MKKLLLVLLFVSGYSFAADPIYTPWFNNLAIKGYDSVAYFTDNKPIEGSEQFEYQWQGATWRFSSAHNLALFKADPEQYAPQYGGYCAYAVAKGKTASIEPEQFTVLNGKLYLNYNASVQQKWQAERDSYIEKADKNWPKVLND
ncbi:YHS domain-containing (seleno)protein [Agarivorans sp. MS3-6]|uniref:YHS domain-containing (seleno)protein n=1 Tax=Agarivorans sp. TSD2052 TaxID=2937286 RepID=UPI00200BD768|nr:YHS domain-containing (seleno)protein [Agarivorans sp. TSD2052]UPW18414.1 YHS domain-containing protein [Agarivorans sp. TSD2052]